MLEPTFTIEQLKAKVIEVAKRNPERIYERQSTGICGTCCSYVDSRDCPGTGCIFGVALKELEPTLEPYLRECSVGSGKSIRYIVDELFPDHQPEYKWWMENVQSAQDDGLTWEAAIRKGDDEQTTNL